MNKWWALCVVFFCLSSASCASYVSNQNQKTHRHKADKVQELIQEGLTPVEASCAVYNNQSTQCTLAAIKDK